MKQETPSIAEVQLLSGTAFVDGRTVAKFFAGGSVRPGLAERIIAAIDTLGFHHLAVPAKYSKRIAAA
jgi:hypothetical protein